MNVKRSLSRRSLVRADALGAIALIIAGIDPQHALVDLPDLSGDRLNERAIMGREYECAPVFPQGLLGALRESLYLND
jgi:hypothetical protein